MDPDFWLRQWEAFVKAPVACFVFLALGAVAAWWFRGSVLRAQIEGLREQIGALREQSNSLDQRLKLAWEQQQAAVREKEAVEKEITTLKSQMKDRAPLEVLTNTTDNVELHINQMGRALANVQGTLQPFGPNLVNQDSGIWLR